MLKKIILFSFSLFIFLSCSLYFISPSLRYTLALAKESKEIITLRKDFESNNFSKYCEKFKNNKNDCFFEFRESLIGKKIKIQKSVMLMAIGVMLVSKERQENDHNTLRKLERMIRLSELTLNQNYQIGSRLKESDFPFTASAKIELDMLQNMDRKVVHKLKGDLVSRIDNLKNSLYKLKKRDIASKPAFE